LWLALWQLYNVPSEAASTGPPIRTLDADKEMNQQSTWVAFLSAAVTAAIVSSVFSMVSLHLQHRWEDQRRWEDRKRHVYATFLHLAGCY